MTAPAEYGQLLRAAHRHAFRAHVTIQQHPFRDTADAADALTARGQLLGALADHAYVVLGTLRVQTWNSLQPSRRGRDPRIPTVQAVISWIHGLREAAVAAAEAVAADGVLSLPGNHPGSPGRPTSARAELDAARDLVRAASDMVATHRDPAGALRPGAPFALAGDDIGGLLARVMEIADIAAATEPWAVRGRQAGLSHAQIDSALPLTSPLQSRTRDLAVLLGTPTSAIDTITVARPAIDIADPAIEWRLRTERIRGRIEQHAHTGRVSARTLHDVASLGLVVGHVLTTSGLHDPTDSTDPGLDLQAWTAVVAHLAPLHSTEPADPTIRADVQRLLEIAHPRHTAGQDREQARLLAAIEASLPTLRAYQHATRRLLTGLSDAWIPARRVPGYLRSPHPPGRAAQPAPPWPPLRTGSLDVPGRLTLT